MRGELGGKSMVGDLYKKDGEMGRCVGLGQKVATGENNDDNTL